MPDPSDFKSYLATEIFSEQRTISYRNVARALKVHVNAAKCMLYEFYEHESKKKPGSIYATYLLSGTKKYVQSNAQKNGHPHDVAEDEDEPMPPSSPPPFTSSMLEPSEHGSQPVTEERLEVTIKTIALVREDALEEVKQQYENITSIHIYSLSPHRIQDLLTLTDISRGLYTDVFAKEDPLIHNKIYGVIQNPEVRRRKGKRPIIPDAPAPKFKAVKDESKPSGPVAKSVFPATTKKEEPARPGSSGSTTSAATNASTKPPNLKRDASDFFKKSFANAKTKPKLKREGTEASTNASMSGTEDVKMIDEDEEGESEDDAIFLDTGTKKEGSKKRVGDVKKERADKAAKLRKMMDSDDEDALPNIEDASGIKADPVTSKPGGAGGEDGDDADVAWSDSDTEKQRQTAPGKDTSALPKDAADAQAGVSSNGEPKRRRGRRKVMHKKTMKDEEGFLVTKEEAVWESFSEDEPEPLKSSAKSNVAFGAGKGLSATQSSAGAAKASKGAAKGGGSIMSFFGKK